MSEDESPEAADDTSTEDETEEVLLATPDDRLVFFCLALVDSLIARQAEILRLAGFVVQREDEFSDAKTRARQRLDRSLHEVDHDAFDQIYDLLDVLYSDPSESPSISPKEQEEAALSALNEVLSTLPDGSYSAYLEEISRVRSSGIGVGLHLSSLLVMLVGEIEVAIGELARVCFERQPEALAMKETQFSWTEIASAESLDDLRQETIDRAVATIMQGSFEEWVEMFAQKFKIEVPKEARTNTLLEAIQRRHCVVHNGGDASRLYVKKVSALGYDAKIGDPLDVDSNYLESVAAELFIAVYSLTWRLGMKLIKDPAAKVTFVRRMADKTYRLLQTERFEALRRLHGVFPFDTVKDEDTRLIMQTNCWLGFKLGGNFDQIRSEIEDFDISAKSRTFNLVKYALLDQHEAAAACLMSLARDGQFRLEYFYAWPLLREVRTFMHEREMISNLEQAAELQ